MDFQKEINQMRSGYTNNRLKNIGLRRPDWLDTENAMSAFYSEKEMLLQHGDVYYACIVQANEILLGMFPHLDCPASIVYSTDPCVVGKPGILREIASRIYSYKGRDLHFVPPEWQELARITTDEYDYTDCTFSIKYEDHPIDIHFQPIMVFRKLLPKRRLYGSLLPVIAAPGCSSAMILPKRYWSPGFKEAWLDGLV